MNSHIEGVDDKNSNTNGFDYSIKNVFPASLAPLPSTVTDRMSTHYCVWQLRRLQRHGTIKLGFERLFESKKDWEKDLRNHFK